MKISPTRIGPRAGGVAAAEDDPDPGDDLADRERLDDVVVGAALEPADPVGLGRRGR